MVPVIFVVFVSYIFSITAEKHMPLSLYKQYTYIVGKYMIYLNEF